MWQWVVGGLVTLSLLASIVFYAACVVAARADRRDNE